MNTSLGSSSAPQALSGFHRFPAVIGLLDDASQTFSEILLDNAIARHLVALLLSLVCIYGFWYFTSCVAKPRVFHFNSQIWSSILAGKLPVVEMPYYPPFWCPDSLSQGALLAARHYITPESSPLFQREDYILADGEVIPLDWCIPNQDPSLPVIIVFPGIIGTLRENVSLGELASTAKGPNFVVVVFHRRGNIYPMRNPNLNALGHIQDVHEVLEHIKRKRPAAKRMFAIAFSAGCGPLVRYLGESGAKSLISMGICVSSGYDADYCFHTIPRIWRERLVGMMKEIFVLRNLQILKQHNPQKLELIRKCKSVYEYYTLTRFFAPGQEHSSIEEFSKVVNPRVVNKSVAVPLLFLHSDDDLFFSKEVAEKYRQDMCKENPNVCFMQTKRGGHICFYEGQLKAVAWTDRLAIQMFHRAMQLPPKMN